MRFPGSETGDKQGERTFCLKVAVNVEGSIGWPPHANGALVPARSVAPLPPKALLDSDTTEDGWYERRGFEGCDSGVPCTR
jgi:hypothetical protein